MSAPQGHAEEVSPGMGLPELPPNVRTALIFGGSFDPPTRAHVELPRQVQRVLGLDWLIYVPAAASPGKPHGPTAGEQDRLDMLQAAVGRFARCSIATIELDRARIAPGPSYTVETLAAMHQKWGTHVRLRLLVGADQAAGFHTWREPRRILQLAEPAVMLRTPDEDWPSLRHRMAPYCSGAELSRWEGWVVSLPTISASSTHARELLQASGPDAAELVAMLPPAVLSLIRSRRLYTRPAAPA